MKQPVIRWFDPSCVIDLPVSTVALDVGDFLSWESSVLVLFDLVTEDATFIGISMGGCRATVDDGKYIPVATKCIIECDLTSAAYTIGQGLLWTSDNTLATAGGSGVNQIAWLFDNDGTHTRANVLIDVPALNVSAGTNKLFEGPAA